MRKNIKTLKSDIETEALKLEYILKKSYDRFNKVHELLFSGNSINTNDLLELEQIMVASKAIAKSRNSIFVKKLQIFNNKALSKLRLSIIFFIPTIIFSIIWFPAITLSIFPLLIILQGCKITEYVKSKFFELLEFADRLDELESRYENYHDIIYKHLEKKDAEIIKEETAQMVSLSYKPDVIEECVSCINDFIDGKITIESIPEKLNYYIILILARDLDTEVSNLPELLALAKERVNQNTKERSRHQ